jgi:hypothetical protein
LCCRFVPAEEEGLWEEGKGQRRRVRRKERHAQQEMIRDEVWRQI